MAITKADIIIAFNEAASKEFSFIPSEDKIEYQFSGKFLKKMDRLINKQSLTHHAFKKIIIVAAVIAVLAVASLSVYAAISDTTILDGLVEIYNKYIVVRCNLSRVFSANKKIIFHIVCVLVFCVT